MRGGKGGRRTDGEGRGEQKGVKVGRVGYNSCSGQLCCVVTGKEGEYQ